MPRNTNRNEDLVPIDPDESMASDRGRDPSKKYFVHLTAEEEPLLPLPADPCPDISYPTGHVETKCQICTSPWKTRLEHEYISSGQKAWRVVMFFDKYFGAKITWTAIATHMNHHCDLSRISQSGEAYLAAREDDLLAWKYREEDLALIALTDQLFDIRGLTCKTVDTKFKRAATMATLTKQILQIKKDRDDSGFKNINFFKVLMEMHNKMKFEEDKKIILETIKELRESISSESD